MCRLRGPLSGAFLGSGLVGSVGGGVGLAPFLLWLGVFVGGLFWFVGSLCGMVLLVLILVLVLLAVMFLGWRVC